ncbi:glycosyltransferase family 2 protein [uncultured Veillonella sp.]|uniref:glycosyltransferase family 2 protein n=1 Tax=uncultured Veillonella sp. TaxID=159268 RepID=UPI0025F94FBD|nr:glycosyltransferase family 2 protein [uncultured Veillonella sp.]MDY3974252.1 glycosyltransferase family 2 protein [Veillonella caviae]
MVDVSVLILTRNEEKNIETCIKSCSFAKEIIVVDDGSTDQTQKLAEGLGATVISRSMNGDWGAQKTFAIEQASCDWIFLIDADEHCSPELAKAIEQAVIQNKPVAYEIQRHNQFKHNVATHGVLRPDLVCRLMPKANTYVEGLVHEKVIHPYPVERLPGALYHYTYQNWEQYFNKFNKYTTLSAKQYVARGKRCSFAKDILFRPLWAFVKVYILNKGFLDGKMGWILASNHYFYTMNKYVKLYYLNKSNGEL